jgi:osmotically-inducible protein OsmY
MKRIFFLIPLLLLNQGCTTAILAGSVVSTGVSALNVMADRRATGVSQEDDRITKDIVEALKKDKEITEKVRVQVYSYNKIVLLAGEAPTQDLINKVSSISATVSGIRKVHSYFELMPAIPKQDQEVDSNLRMLLNSALFMSHGYSAMHPHLTVENGIVYILGLLTRDEGEKMIETIRQLQGVRRVVPLIEYVKEAA